MTSRDRRPGADTEKLGLWGFLASEAEILEASRYPSNWRGVLAAYCVRTPLHWTQYRCRNGKDLARRPVVPPNRG